MKKKENWPRFKKAKPKMVFVPLNTLAILPIIVGGVDGGGGNDVLWPVVPFVPFLITTDKEPLLNEP